MKAMLCAVVLVLHAGLLHCAESVRSCDQRYVATIARGKLHIQRNSRPFTSLSVDHHLSGGAFSLDASLLAIFGVPNKSDPEYPQVTHVSIFERARGHFRLIMRRVYGSGVYETNFSVDQRFLLISTRFGEDVVDLKSNDVEFHEPGYQPDFSLQRCSLTTDGAISREK